MGAADVYEVVSESWDDLIVLKMWMMTIKRYVEIDRLWVWSRSMCMV